MFDWGAGWAGMPTHVQVIMSVLIGGVSGMSALLKSDKATARDWLPQFVSSSVWGFIGFSMTPVLGVEPVISKIGVAAIAGWLGSDSLNIILSFVSRFSNTGPPDRSSGTREYNSNDSRPARADDDYFDDGYPDSDDRSRHRPPKSRLRKRPPIMQDVALAS